VVKKSSKACARVRASMPGPSSSMERSRSRSVAMVNSVVVRSSPGEALEAEQRQRRRELRRASQGLDGVSTTQAGILALHVPDVWSYEAAPRPTSLLTIPRRFWLLNGFSSRSFGTSSRNILTSSRVTPPLTKTKRSASSVLFSRTRR
jgi:hypothetical protein